MAIKTSKAVGRPRSFDTDEALDKAVRLFWRHGYEATAMSDLVVALGISAPSIYAAFGNKAQLFEKAVDRYSATFSVDLYGPINDPKLTTLAAVKGLFERACHIFSEPNTPAGCFMFSAAAAVSPASANIENMLRERRARAEMRLAERLAEGVAKSELSTICDPKADAKYLNCVLEGMSVQARDGASLAELQLIARRTTAAWWQDSKP